MKLMTAARLRPPGGNRRGGRLIRTAALLAVTLVAGAAVPALATGAPAPTTFYACVTTKTGTIKIASKSVACPAGTHKISWNNVGPKGAQGQPGSPGPAGVVNGYIDSVSGPIGLGSNFYVVARLTVPAGKYVITAKMVAQIPGNAGSDTVVCELYDGGSNLLDHAYARLIPDIGGSVATIPLVGGTTVGGNIDVKCLDYIGAASAEFINIEAIPVANLTQTST